MLVTRIRTILEYISVKSVFKKGMGIKGRIERFRKET